MDDQIALAESFTTFLHGIKKLDAYVRGSLEYLNASPNTVDLDHTLRSWQECSEINKEILQKQKLFAEIIDVGNDILKRGHPESATVRTYIASKEDDLKSLEHACGEQMQRLELSIVTFLERKHSKRGDGSKSPIVGDGQNFDELLTKLAGVDQSLRVVQENDARIRQEIKDIQGKLDGLGNDMTTYFNRNSKNHEELQEKLRDVEDMVSKHAGLFKDMCAAQKEVTGVIPEVTQLSNKVTSHLAEYSTRNEYNVKIQTEVQEKLDELKVQMLEQGKQLQEVHALEQRAGELMPKLQDKIVVILDDLTRCIKENAQNLQTQNELQKAVRKVERKLAGCKPLQPAPWPHRSHLPFNE